MLTIERIWILDLAVRDTATIYAREYSIKEDLAWSTNPEEGAWKCLKHILSGLDLGWIYLFTGVLVASAVVPVALR